MHAKERCLSGTWSAEEKMNEDKTEQILLQILEKFDKQAELFRLALSTKEIHKPEWYTPRNFVLRLIRGLVLVSGPEVQAIGVALHGALDLLGFAGTARLILTLRRKHKDGRGTKKTV
jgi:hypothetical protein